MNKLQMIDRTQKCYKKLARIKGLEYNKRAARRAGNINGKYINSQVTNEVSVREYSGFKHYVSLASLFVWCQTKKGHDWYKNIHNRACEGILEL